MFFFFFLSTLKAEDTTNNSFSVCVQHECSSVEQVKGRDCGLFRLLDLRFGQLDATHSDHSTNDKVSPNAANSQPEGPVQAVIQNLQDEEVLSMVCHPLSQTVVLHGCQETKNPQGAKKSCKQKKVLNFPSDLNIYIYQICIQY